MARRKAITHLVIEKLTKKLPVTLDPEEREGLKDTIVALAEKLTTLNREDEAIKLDQREATRARKERIDETEASLRRTQDEHRDGTAEREIKCELRAVIATQSIDLVRMPDGETVETRPMNEDERVKYLQQSLLPDKDEPQSTLVYATGGLPALTADILDAQDGLDADTMPDDECDAIGVPHGWPRKWLDRSWTITRAEGDRLRRTGHRPPRLRHRASLPRPLAVRVDRGSALRQRRMRLAEPPAHRPRPRAAAQPRPRREGRRGQVVRQGRGARGGDRAGPQGRAARGRRGQAAQAPRPQGHRRGDAQHGTRAERSPPLADRLRWSQESSPTSEGRGR